jgi:membrane-associated HD superfamily phosphohydrolase
MAVTPHPFIHEKRVQDPTALTTMQLHRELEWLKDMITARQDEADKAVQLLGKHIGDIPASTDRQIANLRDLHSEKFASVQTQFRERDDRTASDKMAQKEAANLLGAAAQTATSAALQAQKEMAAAQTASNTAMAEKIESNTAARIDGMGTQLASLNSVVTDKFDGINSRLNRGEGVASGHSSTVTNVISIAALLIALLVGVVTIVVAVPHTSQSQPQSQSQQTQAR